MNIDPSLLQPTSILGYILVFLGGIVTSIEPCNIAMIPLIMGIVSGTKNSSRLRSFAISSFFALGLAVTFTAMGVVAALVGGLIGGNSRIWYYLVAFVCFIIGFQMFGLIHLSFPSSFGNIRERIQRKGIPGALLLGLVSGLVSSQCATPVLGAILTYVMAQQSGLLYGAILLFVYALGRGIPIILAGTFTGFLKTFRAFGRWAGIVEKVGGVIMISVVIYFLWIA